MRQDMQKVVGDTRRSGGHAKFPKHRRDGTRDVEDLPMRESMGTRHARDWSHAKGGKAFRSAPIRRWLNAQVGRPWSKVLSELCAGLNRETNAGREALAIVEWYVETDVYIREDGVPMEQRAWNGKTSEVSGLYVNPETGLLCRARERLSSWQQIRRGRDEQALFDKRRQIGPNRFLVKHADNWFIVELATVPEVPFETNRLGSPIRREEHVVIDALLRADVTSPYSYDCKHLSREALYGSDSLYAKTAKQANHQELKRYGVI